MTWAEIQRKLIFIIIQKQHQSTTTSNKKVTKLPKIK